MDDDIIDPNDYADDFNVFEENEIAQDREDFEPSFDDYDMDPPEHEPPPEDSIEDMPEDYLYEEGTW